MDNFPQLISIIQLVCLIFINQSEKKYHKNGYFVGDFLGGGIIGFFFKLWRKSGIFSNSLAFLGIFGTYFLIFMLYAFAQWIFYGRWTENKNKFLKDINPLNLINQCCGCVTGNMLVTFMW